MHLETLFDQAGLFIGYDEARRWLYVDWRGEHTQASVRKGCLMLLNCLRQRPCAKVLNDSSNSERILATLTDWGRRWLVDMHRAGLRYLAWVYPTNYEARHRAERLLQQVQQPVIATFDDLASAYDWLHQQGPASPRVAVADEK